MGKIVDGTVAWIIDEESGAVVGHKKRDNSENGIVTISENAETGEISFNAGSVEWATGDDGSSTASVEA